jgi:hypothetical protein
MGRGPVPAEGVGVAGTGTGELVATGPGELAVVGEAVTPGGVAIGVGTVVVGLPEVEPPASPIPIPQQKLGDGSRVGVLVPTGGNFPSGGVLVEVGCAVAGGLGAEPATESVPDRLEPAPAEGLPAGTGWFGGTEIGPGPNGISGRGRHVGDGVGFGDGFGVGVGVGVATTWAITMPEGWTLAGRTIGLARVELVRSNPTTSGTLVDVVPYR